MDDFKTQCKKLGINIGITIASILVLLITVEVAARIMSAKETALVQKFKYKPRSDGKPVVTDKNQFRKPLPLYPKTEDTIRIVALGDSITWGDKISDYRDLWTSVLERDLQAAYPDKRIEVATLGIKGFTTVNELELLSGVGLRLEPDLIVVQYTLNDPLPSGRNFQHKGEEWMRSDNKDLAANTVLHKILSKSYFYNFLNNRYGAAQYRMRRTTYYDQLYEDDFGGWIACRKALKAISNLADKSDAEVVLMVFPVLQSGKWSVDTYPYVELHKKIVKAGMRANMYVLDLLMTFVDRKVNFRSFRALNGHDPHPNEDAHKLIANTLSRYIVEKKLIRGRV